MVGGGRTFDGRAVVNRRLGEEEDGVDGRATAFFRARRGKKEEEKKRIARKSIAEGRAAASFACGPRARKETGIWEIKEFRAGGFRYTGKGGSRQCLRRGDSAARALPISELPSSVSCAFQAPQETGGASSRRSSFSRVTVAR